ncbi:HlyD family efflux transporter periplasmic adaptor subunit [Gymnodinialimonas sp. 2305UL16-5]|uniref:efflux RND transporter periplasmic adaptor subunit n=1 Tax=Gymnodinialimonas mytili TaxID=3126503 RepID=UPI0030B67586
MEAISSVSVVEPNAPVVRWIEARAKEACSQSPDSVQDIATDGAKAPSDYPFAYLLWVPFVAKTGRVYGGVILAAETPWEDRRRQLADRLRLTYGHAWQALTRGRVAVRGPAPSKVLSGLSVLTLAALIFVRVPITAIAPVEIVGRNTLVMSAPLDGVVEEVLVRSNQPVNAGDVLARFNDTELRNAAAIARQRVTVAQTRVAALNNRAFSDAEARREIAIAEAELELARAELDLADERLARTELRAPAAGIAIITDPSEWRGRPVETGQRIVEIADPADIEYRIDLAVDDLIVLDAIRPIRVFLDAAPLAPRTAEITQASYRAEQQPSGVMSYDIRASDMSPDDRSVRIGARGTAQVMGQDAALWFVVFRRPLSWMRQTLGI